MSGDSVSWLMAREFFSICGRRVDLECTASGGRGFRRVVTRYLDGKEFVYYYVDRAFAESVFVEVLKRLREVVVAGIGRYSFRLGKGAPSVIVLNMVPSDAWYRLGLALGDGSLLGRGVLIFTTSSPDTLAAIIGSFRELKVYLARVMRNPSGRLGCVFNIVVRDEETANRFAGVKEGNVSQLVKELRKVPGSLAAFLAGVIDSDGIIDKDGIRVSLQQSDPVYLIVRRIFRSVTYDEKRFTLRLSTEELRAMKLLSLLVEKVRIPRKRRALEMLLSKRERHDYRLLKVADELIELIKASLSDEDIALIKELKVRRKGKYVYLYIPASGERQQKLLRGMREFLRKVSCLVDLDVTGSVKLGNREVIIYSQKVVSLIMRLREKLIRE